MINESNQDFARSHGGSIKELINPSNENKMVIVIKPTMAIKMTKNTQTPRLELSFIQSQEDGAR